MKLTPREAQVLALLADGKQPKKIASMLGIEYQSVITRVFTAKKKLGATSGFHAGAIFAREKVKEEI